MLSIQELIGEVLSIKQQSEQLAGVVGGANRELGQQSMMIAGLVQGSRTGQEAVQALQVASRALADAGASMTVLGRICDTCVQSLGK